MICAMKLDNPRGAWNALGMSMGCVSCGVIRIQFSGIMLLLPASR